MPANRISPTDWMTTLASAAAMGVLYYLLASPAAHIAESTTIAPIVWPAPSLLIALLWRKPYREWWPYLVAVFIAMVLVGDLDALPVSVDAGFALLNVLQIAACTLVGRRFVARDGHLDSMRRLTRFILFLPLLTTGVLAVFGATLAAYAMHENWWQEWRILLVGNGLAVLVLVPVLLYWAQPGRDARAGKRLDLPTLLSSTAVAGALLASILFPLSEEVLRVLLSLALAGAALYGGMRSATLGVSLAAVLAVMMTLFDLGPYSREGLESTWSLQVDLIGLTVLTYFVAVAVRERQALSARMEQMRRFESLGLMAGGIAHDFNNVLGAVGGYAEMAHDRTSKDSPVRAPLDEVMSAVARGRDLTEQILLAARRGDRQRILLDVRNPVEEAVRLARPLCRKEVTIEFVVPDEAVVVNANPSQLTRVALNLVRNASQAARSKVVVSLHAGLAPVEGLRVGDIPPEDAVWLDVADDGAGIAPEHMSRLFDPFFSTRTGPGGKGTGLGLAIVAGIATEHDGGVSVTSSSAGTRFRLLLPGEVNGAARLAALAPVVVAAGAVEVAPSAEDASRTADEIEDVMQAPIGRGECVFVVDDDQAMRELAEDWLAAMGFEPIGFADPAEALAEIAEEPLALDLLLTDWDMPGMKGDALIREARALRDDLPAVLASGDTLLPGLAAALAVPALPKPFNQDALRQAIITALPQAANREE